MRYDGEVVVVVVVVVGVNDMELMAGEERRHEGGLIDMIAY